MNGLAAPKPPSLDIMPAAPTPRAILGGGAPPAPQAPAMREFGDAKTTRRFIYEDALAAANNIEPLEDDNYQLKLSGVDWHDPERFSRKQRKQAILTGETLARRMRGTWELYDKKSGQLLGKRQQIIGAVPYLSSMGTFIHRGNEYTVNHQQRLRPGVFARIRDNGELESHFNILPGKGVSHRYFLDPEKSAFKVKFGQSEMPLMPLLYSMGATDREIRDAWGGELWQANAATNDTSVLKKLGQKLLRRRDLEGATDGDTSRRLAERFAAMELDPEVTSRTLGKGYDRVTKEAILAATAKLLKVNRKEADPDDRDHLAYQQFVGPEDLFSERLRRDHGGVRRGLFKKIAQAGTLDRMPSGALTPQLTQVLLGSGLAQALEEINPAEVFDKQTRITRLGEGGIPSVDSIPDEARSVQPSHMGFMDPIRTPESFRVGVDLHMARASRKGRDGRIYTQVRDNGGKLTWKSPQDLAEAAIVTPEVLKDPFWSDMARVPVMQGGKLEYVTRDKIDYTLPDFSSAFSPLANLIPFVSATKPGRVSMGSRYMTQALPVANAEAPWVQSGITGDPEGRSYEDDYGKHMGAVRADKGGRVVDVHDGVVKVKYDDGTSDDVELYQHHPFNRKTYIHQTPLVRPGDTFKPGQLLAKSNYTDDTGATALGLNMRVAYFPYKGLNFEDAQVISESAAKRLTSEHMYQHELEVTDKHKTGLKPYIALFAGKYDRSTLAKMDEKGVIRVGETVEYGQPLVLAAKEADRAHNKVHKKRQPGYTDDSVTWKHHDPGVVTDVVWGKGGPVVLVKSSSSAQVGDKLSGRYGDKGVIAAIVPDDQMPHDKDGKPYEVLLSPDGIITRTNPSQKIESALGKIAAAMGKPVKVPDFNDVADLEEWAEQQLRQHGLRGTEDVYWPEKGVRVPDVGTGYRFLMKLHHTAESKGQGRDSGAYSTDETPAKGGETGCFVGDTEVMVYPEGSDSEVEFAGASPYPIPIRELVERQFTGDLPTVELPKKRRQPVESVRQAVTDWFHYRVPAGDIVTITLANGESFSCTKNHELVCKNHRKVLAGDVRRGDVLLGWAADVEVAGVTAYVATTCRALVDVYDITVAGTHLYNLAAGVIVSNSKRLALLDVNALLSHGGTETLRDVGAVRGQKNEDLWMQFMSGLTPGRPRVPMVYEKFINQLKAAGINVVRNGFQTQVMALTRKDVDTLAGDREIRSGDTVRFDRGLKPIKGGLFDDHLTGGHAGKKWSYIRLPEPMPNPVMEEPIRRILGLTGKQFEAVLRGEHEVAGFGTGPKAIAKALDNINLDKEIDAARAQYYSGKASARDAAVRRWGYLKSAKRLGLHPREWVLDKAPVLPPAFRPVSLMGDSGIPLVSDPNYLYKELLDANKNYKDLKDQVGADDLGHERLAVYHAFKAITGLGDPVHPKLQEKGVKGVLKNVFGTSPKFGTVQRKLISSTVDSVGRAVITPNPDFDMDTVGIPEKQAFAVYRKSIVRRLRRRGMDIRTALHHVREKTDLARDVLTDEMENRPVYINRAPVLHRFGIMAFKPKLVKGDVLQVSPLIVSGFNADFDGDAMQFHVPMTDEAVKEAYDRLLPSRSLLSPADFKSPVHKPGQQYLAGLYHATRRHEAEGGKKRRSRVFRSVADVVAAHARGEIRADEDVQILE